MCVCCVVSVFCVFCVVVVVAKNYFLLYSPVPFPADDDLLILDTTTYYTSTYRLQKYITTLHNHNHNMHCVKNKESTTKT